MGQRRDWAKTLDEFEQSGLSVKTFAQKIECSTTSLYRYKNLRAETRQRRQRLKRRSPRCVMES